jgi:p-cymene monooxygenase electron transfer component
MQRYLFAVKNAPPMGLLDKLFGQRTATITVEPSGVSFSATRGQSILEAALAQGIAFPHSCTVGTCGSCKCRLKAGRIREISNFAYVLSAAELQSEVILACQAEARGDVVLDVAGLSAKRLHPAADYWAELIEVLNLTHDIKRVTLALDRPLDFDAGQYAQLAVDEVHGARAYSFAVPPATGGRREVSFCVRHVPGGAFTDWLFADVMPGHRFRLHAPLGNFWLRDSRAAMLCIAGGSGLAPLLSILEDAAARQVGRPCMCLFGARTTADLYALEELARIGANWNGAFQFVPVLSHEEPTSAWTGARGLVTDRIAASTAGLIAADSEAYLCGPPPMVDAAIAALVAHGLAPANIHFDKFLDGSHGLARPGA